MKKISKIMLCVGCLCIGTLTIGGVLWANANAKDGDGETLTGADLIAPEITVATKEFSLDNAPNAVKGKSYAIFDATAKDIYGKNVYVSTKLWSYYDSETRALISIENNSFIPEAYGVYTVEYTAVDARGNKTILTYDFACEEKAPLTATFDGGAQMALTGDLVDVGLISFLHNIGNVNYEITAILQGNESIRYEATSGEFIPLYAGTYDVKCAFSDYNESGEECYQITVSAANMPVAVGEPDLPRYFIVGASYQMPSLSVYDCSSGMPVSLNATITAAYGSDGAVALDGDTFIPEKEGEVTISYTAENANGELSVPFVAQTVDVGFTSDLKMAKYFASSGLTATANNTGISLSIDEENASATFINSLLVNDFSLDFFVNGEKNSFEKMNIILTDSIDETQSVKFTVENNTQTSSLFSINNGRKVKSGVNFYDGNVGYFTFNCDTCRAQLGNSDTLVVETYEDGREFKGFFSGKAYVTFTFEGRIGESEILVTRLNNQALYDTYGDGVAPIVIFKNYEYGEKVIGDTVSIPRIYIADILDPNVSVSYSVYAPDRNYVTDIDGVVLNSVDHTKAYTFVVDQIGTYSVSMYAEDSFGNYSKYSFGITVEDDKAPILVLSQGVEKCKVGETVQLKSATVQDNLESNIPVYVFAALPDGRVEEIKPNAKGKYVFIPKNTGVYEIWYYAADSVGNVKTVSYTLTVKEA